jgi:predicted nucleic-acid-binding protein
VKAVDTNILARYFRDDDPLQSRRAAHFIQQAVRRNEPLYLNHVVLSELVWVLTAVYEHRKDEIVNMLEAVLLTGQFEIEDKHSVESALEDYKNSKADFPDCLIGRRNHAAGCESTLTFDRTLKNIDAFEVV